MKIIILMLSFFLISCEHANHVVIDAPVEEVWKYVANSANAKEWSVYFDHITPLPGSPDGGVGALRRCFRRADESGNTWDEEVKVVNDLVYRQIRTYNLQGFPKGFERAQFKVHQRFLKLSDNKTRLSFGSELVGPKDFFSMAKFLFKQSEGNRIIKLNLQNIRAAIESRNRGESYKRPYLYEDHHVWDQVSTKSELK